MCKAVLEHVSCFSRTGSFIQLIPRETPPPPLASQSEHYSRQYQQQAGDERAGWRSGISIASGVRKERTRYLSSCNNKKKPSLEKSLEKNPKPMKTPPPTTTKKQTTTKTNHQNHGVLLRKLWWEGTDFHGKNSVLTVFGSYSLATILYRCFKWPHAMVLLSVAV